MKRGRSARSFWPSPQQRLLLETALGDATETLAAWDRLRPAFDLQTIEDGSFATLPLVYRALDKAAPDDPLLPRLKGIYRNTWARNTLLVERLGATFGALTTADLPVLVVGSIGAALRYYPALGLRPTPSVEFLVQKPDLLRAVAVLGRSGWVARGARSVAGSDSTVLLSESGHICLLRTMLAPDLWGLERHAGLCAARQIDEDGLQFAALAPTDDLLVSIVTGARVPAQPVQWIVDAAMILRTEPGIDWERLVANGVGWGQGLRLRDALACLDELPGTSIPAGIRRRLEERRPGRRERLAYACTARTVPALGSFPAAVGEHLAETSGLTIAGTAVAFPGFLRRRWHLEHTRQLPLAGARRAYRTLVGRREEAVHQA